MTETPAAREAFEAALAGHRLTTPVQCLCGWRETDNDWGTHEAHLADALLPFLAEREAAARLSTRHEIADDLRQGRLGIDCTEAADTLGTDYAALSDREA